MPRLEHIGIAVDDVNTVAEKLEHGEIEGRAVITP